MILIEMNGARMLVTSLAGYDGCTVIEQNVAAPPPFVTAADLGDDGTVPLELVQAALWEQVKAIREEKLLLSPAPPFGTAQTDLESMVKINGLVSMAMLAKGAGQPFSEVFTLADNSEVTFNADQMIGFGVAIGTHIAAIHARGRELRAAIDAAPTMDDLGAIDIEVGWP